jgi:hypothetical protein
MTTFPVSLPGAAMSPSPSPKEKLEYQANEEHEKQELKECRQSPPEKGENAMSKSWTNTYITSLSTIGRLARHKSIRPAGAIGGRTQHAAHPQQ